MKRKYLTLIYVLPFLALVIFNCSKSEAPVVESEPEPTEETPTEETPVEEPPIVLDNEINDFVWRGLNDLYLWQADVPNLSDTEFFTMAEYITFYNNYDDTENLPENIIDTYFPFLNGYNTPESLFDDLIYEKDVVDKFSWIVDDYIALENSFQGTYTSNGVDFQLVRLSGTNDIFGYVRYIANDSDASTKDIHRGDYFLTVDGQQLTINNYTNLLFGSNNTYTLGMATISNNTISNNGKTVELTKIENFTENPILVNKTIDVGGVKIGYLMYNQFAANFDDELNDAFAQLKADGATELVLDLRYNPGGYGYIATELASMITGQFDGDIFYKEQWNDKYQAYFEANDPEYLLNRFVNKLSDDTPLNSLNLNRVYILTTDETASSSELIINGLNPYIDVIQIGTNTYGKFNGSVTIYDSPNFGKSNANPSHRYAMQPIVLKSTNVNDVSDYYDGLVPDYLITYDTSSGTAEGENILNLGELGNENEPFLAKAIELITGSTAKLDPNKTEKQGLRVDHIVSSKDFAPLGSGLIVDFKPMK
ncbi:peptidase S41 [Flavobacteriaceae bacterium XHP0103]|uniref:S41 family peptidase n=1 Tax=Marixanthotalea marina TaxID=2844359 RepID=UPI002989CD84|nr:S41 family peptidase [Marixanthotalea marina]MBU3821700.1 peptidase S41 [Marixanthotalea marina]